MVYRPRIRFGAPRVGRSKGRRGRVYRPRTVKAVAKRVTRVAISRMVEHKRIGFTVPDLIPLSRVHYVFNPLSPIAKGTGENQRIGDKISNIWLNLALSYQHLGIGGSTEAKLVAGSVLRILVFRSRHQLNHSTYTWNAQDPTTGLFASAFADPNQVSISPVNRHEITPIKEFFLRSTDTGFTQFVKTDGSEPVASPFAAPTIAKLRVKLGQQFRYSDEQPVFGKLSNIYVMVGVSSFGSPLTWRMGQLQCSGYLSWTDA